MTSLEAHIALNMIDGVGPATYAKLRAALGDAVNIFSATESQLSGIAGINADTVAAILNWEKTIDLAAEIRRIQNAGCHIILKEDEEYPKLLKEIYNPPFLLYVRGQILPQDHNSIAIVGSRLTTYYGIETAQKFAQQLAYAGITVVSGGARGIDTAAHWGALNSKGRTISILGNGINVVYPAENVKLFEEISQNGAVISQFPMNLPGNRSTYSIRNRIVAGMTLGTLVVEATQTSGALITSGLAAEMNRQVFAVPGNINSPQSSGCNRLIKEGAKLCDDIQDILSEFEYISGFRSSSARQQDEQKEKTPVQEEIPFTLPTTATVPLNIKLTPQETAVLAAITYEEQHIDALIQKTALPTHVVLSALCGLELKKQVQQLPGKLYRRRK
ncbi:MAG: DNA-processing protein DprA [Verrucomicrobia bacterium]|nr:DNA-processing protein DprA [Verrucomicrobiota bacterium]